MIHEKILKVMQEIGPMNKDKKNEEENFEYVSLAAIVTKVREAFIKFKVTMRPVNVDQIVRQGDSIVISMKYELFDIDSKETITLSVPGERKR